MAVEQVKGNIFASRAQTIVNTVNCEGVMGAGLALEFRLREPEMFKKYAAICRAGELAPGKLWLYKASVRLVLNFPTKTRWKLPSRPEYLEAGLRKFAATYRAKGITSIAFPLLGADKGGLSPDVSREIMMRHLSPLTDLAVEIYEYDPKARDDLFDRLEAHILDQDIGALKRETGIQESQLSIIQRAVAAGDICQVNQIGRLPGVGEKSLAKLYAVLKIEPGKSEQGSLFG